jgi:hypothetical protein
MNELPSTGGEMDLHSRLADSVQERREADCW